MLKAQVKKIIGQENWAAISGKYKQLKCFLYYLKKKNEKCAVSEDWTMNIYSEPNSHTFFGYYDIPQLDRNESKLLAHIIPLTADSQKDSAKVGYFNIGENRFHAVAETNAWCWQQGARLRWHPINDNWIVFNNVAEGRYVTQIWDIDNNECKKVIDRPLYDFNQKFTFGLSLNFSRLQRLRPGYGYNTLHDQTEDENAPEDEGIFYVDLEQNQSELIVKLRELAENVDPDLKYQHYINHISIAPDGKRFMFFHIWNVSSGTGWRTRLFSFDLENKELVLLEDVDKVSHYDWRGNEEILVTCYRENKSQYYALYNVNTHEKTLVAETLLIKDGHPSFEGNENAFITDTYPLAHCKQRIYRYHLGDTKLDTIVTIYSSPVMSGEKRCDLHPRLSMSEKWISFDSTYSQNRRKIIVLKRRTDA